MWLLTNNYKLIEISIKYYKNIYFIVNNLGNVGHLVCVWGEGYGCYGLEHVLLCGVSKNTGGHPSGRLRRRTTLDRSTQ